ncbi:MAG: hypothetical protein JJU46_01175 [Balneolaceae bacterium]|nr:hypothetical protein [Balneolaceae bacterium]
MELPWLTPEIHQLILVTFANVFWIFHFAFTSTRLLNMEENRKLLAFGYPVRKLTWHLNLMCLYHPVNVIYNITWIIFLVLQIQGGINIPVVVAAVLLNYGIIYSIKHRFLRMVERRFKIIVFSGLFIIFGVASVIAIFSRRYQADMGQITIEPSALMDVLIWLPGGLLYQSTFETMTPILAGTIFFFLVVLTFLIFRDHFYKTKEGLMTPNQQSVVREQGRLFGFLKRWLGANAGKYYFYVATHSYNKLQLLAIALIPLVYVPLLLIVDLGAVSTTLIAIVLAAIPVALLGMVMANMFGYENREFLLHMQLPVPLEKQLKERFLGIILIPLFIFYGITIFELLMLPQLGSVFSIYIANTFFFTCFMMVFLWSSFYHYQRVSYSSFSFKHPIISQKVTFTMSAVIFILGYAVFVPLGEWQPYRLWVMAALILAITIYIWRNFDLLAKAFRARILEQIWREF